jgi:hypothetical protein
VTNDLHSYLSDLAEEVIPVDLRDRVLVTSRRATTRRRVLTASAAAVAVVAVASGIAWAGRPGPKADGVLPAISHSPSVAVTPRPSGSASTGLVQPAVNKVPQILYYLKNDTDLYRLDGTSTTPVFEPRGESCGLTVAPNRSRIAHVAPIGGGGHPGDLIVARPDGRSAKTLRQDIHCGGGSGPFWTDSQHLLITPVDGPRVVVDVRNGKVSSTPFADTTGYVVRSPNGLYVAYREDQDIVVTRHDGTVIHRVAHGNEQGPDSGFSVQGVSDNGRYALAGVDNTDPGVVRRGRTVVDMTTGDKVPLPAAIPRSEGPDFGVHLTAGNHLLVRARVNDRTRLYLVSPTGKVIDTRTEPATLREMDLLTSY